MMRGRSPMKIKPQTESGREHTLPRNGTSRSGHVRNNSMSTIEGDFSNSNLHTESSDARKDLLQNTTKKSQALTRSSSARQETTRSSDSNNIKKPPAHHYMKTTKCFNAKSQRQMDLEDSKVKKKSDLDPYRERRKSEVIRGYQYQRPAEPIYPYLKGRSRSPSVDSQNTSRLKRSPSLNSSRLPRQHRQDSTKQVGKKKTDTKGETKVGRFISDQMSYTEHGKSVVEEIVKEESSYSHFNTQEKIVETEGTEIETDLVSQTSIKEMEVLEETGDSHSNKRENIVETEIETELISQTSIKDEMEVLEETRDLGISFNLNITSGNENSEKLEVISKNIPEIETKETIIEGSQKQADCNLEVMTRNKNLEKHEGTEETMSGNKNNVTESFPLEKITKDKNENYKQHEVIDTKYEEIDDLCVLSSSNDETEDLREISIEDELSKIIGTVNTDCSEQEQNALSTDIVSVIEEIANELEGMEEDSAVEHGNDMHPTWRMKKWKADYVVQRLTQKLGSTNNNKVSILIQAYESIIPLMMCRKAVQPVPHQVSGQ